MPIATPLALSRRSFVASAALAPLGAAAAGQQPPPPLTPRAAGRPAPKREGGDPLPDSERLGWAVVGLGDFAANQMIPAFEDSRMARITGFVSGNPAKLADYGRRHGVTSLYTYDQFDRISNDPAIDVVYIVLPNSLHAEYAIRALDAGKHVFCEKPMAVTVAECERMIAAAKRRGRQLGIAYRAHFEPHNLEAERLLKSGAIGTLRHFTSEHGRILDTSKPADQWRADKRLAGGGSLYDIGVYALNAACWFMGADPVAVDARISNPANDPRFATVEDIVSWRMRFPDGRIATCMSGYSFENVKRYQFFGSTGTLKLDGATDYYDNSIMLENQRGQQDLSVGQASEQFAGEIDGFCEAVRANRPHKTPAEMGLRDVRIMEAIYRSAENDGRTVRL